MPPSRCQLPKPTGHPYLLENRCSLIQRFPSPIFIPAVFTVPCLGQRPGLLHSERTPARLVPHLAPTVYMLFRPEEEHRLNTIDAFRHQLGAVCRLLYPRRVSAHHPLLALFRASPVSRGDSHYHL